MLTRRSKFNINNTSPRIAIRSTKRTTKKPRSWFKTTTQIYIIPQILIGRNRSTYINNFEINRTNNKLVQDFSKIERIHENVTPSPRSFSSSKPTTLLSLFRKLLLFRWWLDGAQFWMRMMATQSRSSKISYPEVME